MSERQIFKPNGKPTSVLFFWLIPILLSCVILIKYGFDLYNIIGMIFIFMLFSLEILFYKNTISITVDNNLLIVDYTNCWRQKKQNVINLKVSSISFKYRLLNLTYRIFGKLKFGWRILIYEGNYFHNRIIIKEDDKIGFNKSQLEQIYKLVIENKSIPILSNSHLHE